MAKVIRRTVKPEWALLKEQVLAELIDLMDQNPPIGLNHEKYLRELIAEAYSRQALTLGDEEKEQFLAYIKKYVSSYDLIEPLLKDKQVSEIMINGPDTVYKEVRGELLKTDIKFEDDRQVRFLINQIINPLGRFINQRIPMVDAHLPDGSRLNAVIPPIIKQGSVASIRKFLKEIITMEELIRLGAISEQMAEFLTVCVQARMNILVAGNTSSGKTTLLNILAGSVSGDERIITIEDSLELQLKQSHVLSMETRPADNHGEGEILMRELVRNVMRMRPDRIIVGEVRGPEALDMLNAMNTGHDGSMSTIHANSPRDAVARIETMCMMAGLDIPVAGIRKQVASAIDLIVFLNRYPDGTRKLSQISEIVGMEGEVISMTDLFRFTQTGLNEKGQPNGQFHSTGLRPMFMHKILACGLQLDPKLFQG